MSDSSNLTGAVYIRVSTNGQMELSPDSQLREISDYAKSQGICIPEAFIFMEKEGHSGKSAKNRPEFQKMIASAKQKPRPFDVILVWKFSRFARNRDESAFYKGMLRKKLGIDVISISEPVCGGMYGRLIEMIIEWQDEFYSCNLSSEVRRGMAEHARQGGYQAPVPFGYEHNGPGSVPTLNQEAAAAVRFIFSQFTVSGCSPAEIAVSLNEKGIITRRGNPFDRRAVLYILRNPFYTGKIRWDPNGRKSKHRADGVSGKPDPVILSEGRHTALIPWEQFQKAQDRLCTGKEAKCLPLKKSSRHLLSGILKCPVCGASLSYSASQSPVFQCWRYARGLHKGSASISARRAMNALFASLRELETAAGPIFHNTTPDLPPSPDGSISINAGDRPCIWISQQQYTKAWDKEWLKRQKSLEAKKMRILAAYENGIDSLEEYQIKKEQLAAEQKQLSEIDWQKDIKPKFPPVTCLSELISSQAVPEDVKSRAIRAVLTSACYHRDEDAFYFYYSV